jgi:hypothetical protein
MNAIECHQCGKLFDAEELDAKPGAGHWSMEQLAMAADTGRPFDRLECKDCYGPGYLPLSVQLADQP